MDASPLDARDLENLWKALDAAVDRGAFKLDELKVIDPLNAKLGKFITAYNEIKKKKVDAND